MFLVYLQTSVLPRDSALSSVSPLLYVLPTVFLCLGVAISVWFLAPHLAKVALPEVTAAKGEPLPFNDTMIFCVGLVLMAWAIGRVANWVSGYFVRDGVLDANGMVYLGMTAMIFVFGAVLLGKFHRISEWMRVRRPALTGE